MRRANNHDAINGSLSSFLLDFTSNFHGIVRYVRIKQLSDRFIFSRVTLPKLPRPIARNIWKWSKATGKKEREKHQASLSESNDIIYICHYWYFPAANIACELQ